MPRVRGPNKRPLRGTRRVHFVQLASIMNKPLWNDTGATFGSFPQLTNNLQVDVAIVGGGITGLTAAWLLRRAGKTVAVLEGRELLSGVTGSTTAHLTQIVDTRYHQIEKDFGAEAAQIVAGSSLAAIQLIELIIRDLKIECGFRRLPGYLFAQNEVQQVELLKEMDAAERAGLLVRNEVPAFPLPIRAAMRVDNQAEFDPRRYLAPIAKALASEGVSIFEHSPVEVIKGDSPCELTTKSGLTVRAEHVIEATHSPLNLLLLQTKIAHYQSYVVSGPTQKPLEGLFWDMENPYHYIRTQQTPSGIQLIVGGNDHKTGQMADTENEFSKLIQYTGQLGVTPTHRWSAQVVEPVDGLPFIGRNSNNKSVFVATGFSGNGMTFGTIAAMVISDLILQRKNDWSEVYSATRVKPVAGFASYVSENIDFPLYLIGGALKPAETSSVEDVGPGEGKIVAVGLKRVAVFRDEKNTLHAVSSLCTHMACRVQFNNSEKTWDCPCHGSRFSVDGDVLDGPAVIPLAKIELPTGKS